MSFPRKRGVVAWLFRCHSRAGGNPEHYGHPEFISGSINEMLKQVQHDII